VTTASKQIHKSCADGTENYS